mmetsp:Transcript_99502/g.197166  ORF Transcript_99502/g.197166 Transcript_99502/m.197166 type:complete len:129 (+) Transcript_99502:551-937(+)
MRQRTKNAQAALGGVHAPAKLRGQQQSANATVAIILPGMASRKNTAAGVVGTSIKMMGPTNWQTGLLHKRGARTREMLLLHTPARILLVLDSSARASTEMTRWRPLQVFRPIPIHLKTDSSDRPAPPH